MRLRKRPPAHYRRSDGRYGVVWRCESCGAIVAGGLEGPARLLHQAPSDHVPRWRQASEHEARIFLQAHKTPAIRVLV